jgi:threonyl-tRNA synthetase
MLTRIYGTAWRNGRSSQRYLHALEEAEKRDHRKLGREMDLFHFQEEGPGVVFWHPKGWAIFKEVIAYMRAGSTSRGYDEVNAPQILDKSLWETSGHWEWYRENMFVHRDEDERVFAIKPMNCPGHVQIFKHGLKSYRDLPMRLRSSARFALRAVGGAAWADAGAGLHPGRCAYLLHRGADAAECLASTT